MSSNAPNFQGRDFWDGAINMTAASQGLHSVSNITSPYSSCPLELTVFVPCYNDEKNIIQTLTTIAEAMDVVGNSYEILVIDDGSKDRSVELVRGFMAQYENLHIVMRINKNSKGLAQNYFDGAFMGCGTYYRLVYGSNSEPVETMVDIFRSIGDADIIVPYYITRLKKEQFHSFWGRVFNSMINTITGNRINCYTAQHMHLRYNVMRWHSDVLGQAFQMDLLCQLLSLDFTYKQVPCRAISSHSNHNSSGFKKTLSFTHALINIIFRRFARLAYNKHR